MRSVPISAALYVALTAGFGLAVAQTAPATPAVTVAPARPAPAEGARGAAPSSSNQLIERIRVESNEVRIDEVRYGGETRSISVVPKGGFPAYDVQPATGERTWKILGF